MPVPPYTNDGATGFYPLAIPTNTPGNPIGTAQGWSPWAMDGYVMTTPNIVAEGALRQETLTVALAAGANTVAHNLTDIVPGQILVIPQATPSGVVFPTAVNDATNIYLNSAVAQTATLVLLY